MSLVHATTTITPHYKGYDADGRSYAAMAEDPLVPSRYAELAPFCYRVLTPFLASLLPFATLTSFTVLAFVANVLSLLVLTWILRHYRFSPRECALGVLLYAAVFWTCKFSFFSPAYIDHVSQLILLSILWLTLRGAYVWLIPLFVLAALQKESLVAFSAFSVLVLFRSGGRRSVSRRLALAGAILAAPLITTLLIRLSVEPQNAWSPAVLVSHFGAMLEPSFWPILLQAAFSGLGVLPILLLLHPRPWLRFLGSHREWWLWILISFVFLFGGIDKARLFLYALPLVVILALHVSASFGEIAPRWRFLAWIALTLAVHAYLGGHFTPMGTFREYLARMVPVHSEGQYVPHLLRNLALGSALAVLTVLLIFGPRPWRSQAAGGSA